MASEPVSALGAVVTDNDNHLIEFGAHLDAARETTVRGVGCVISQQAGLLE